MDAIVTARVPVEVKAQVNAILHELGSSPTKLINAAYEYVLRHHALPLDSAGTLGPEMVVRVAPPELVRRLESCLAPLPEDMRAQVEELGYEEYLARERQADHEARA